MRRQPTVCRAETEVTMDSQFDCIYAIKEMHDSIKRHADGVLRQYGLTMVQMGALTLLNMKGNGECTFKEFEQLLHLAQSTTVEIVKRLEQKGYVTTHADAQDKRIKKVRITQVGIALSDSTVDMVRTMSRKMFSGLSEEEIETFVNVTKKIYDNIQESERRN